MLLIFHPPQVREYMRALVATDAIAQYGERGSAVDSSRSLSGLLSEMKAAADGEAPAAKVGESISTPMHVVIQARTGHWRNVD